MKFSKLFLFSIVLIVLTTCVFATNYQYWRQDDSTTNVYFNQSSFTGIMQFKISNVSGIAQNGYAVFSQGSDCREASVNTSVWNTPGTLSWVQAGGECIVTSTGGAGDQAYYTKKNITYPATMLIRLKDPYTKTYSGMFVWNNLNNSNSIDFYRISAGHVYAHSTWKNPGRTSGASNTFGSGTYYNFKIDWLSTSSVKFYRNLISTFNSTTNIPTTSLALRMVMNPVSTALTMDYVWTYKIPTTIPKVTKTYVPSGKYWLVTINNTAGVDLTGWVANITGINLTGNLKIEDAVSNYSITAVSSVDSSAITSFSVRIKNGSTTKNYYTSSGTVSKILSTDKRKYNITFYNLSDFVNRTYINYNFSTSGNLIGSLYPTEEKVETIKFYYSDPIEVSATSYETIYHAEFNIAQSKNAYISTILNTYALNAGNYSCKNSINSSDYNSENNFSIVADALGNVKLLSDVFTLPLGHYSYQVKCKVSSTPIIISEIYGKITLGNLMQQSNSNLISFTTSGSVLTTKVRSAYLDSLIKSNYNNLKIYINVSGTNKTYIIRTDDTNFGYDRLFKSLSASKTYGFNYYANQTITVKSILFETIGVNNEYNTTTGTSSVKINNTYYKNISSLRINVTNNTLVASAFLIINSTSDDDVGLKLKVGSQEYFYFKTIDSLSKEPITIENVFNVSNGLNTVLLQAYMPNRVGKVLNYTFNAFDSDKILASTNSLVVYAKDVYKNISLTNFSVWYENTKYNTDDGKLQIYIQPRTINFTLGSLQNGGYINKSYLNFNTSNYVNTSIFQTNVTFIFKHLASNETITAPVTVHDHIYTKTVTTTSSVRRFYFPVSVLYAIFNNSNYVIKNQTLNLTPYQTGNIYIYLQPIINFSIYNEKTGTLFNLSIPESIKVQVICENLTEILEYTIDSVTDKVNLTCKYDKIKFIVEYPGSSYYRTYPNIAEVFSITNFNFRAWLLELNTTDVIYNSFNIYDLFGDYINPQILLYKVIGDQQYLITGDNVDATKKISAFLIQNTEYIIKVLSDNQPERVMGTYFADLAGEKTIRLFDISLSSSTSEYSSQVRDYIYLVNESNNILVRAAVNDSGTNIQTVTFTVRENNDGGAIICQQTSLTNNVEFSCDVDDTANNLYYASLQVTTSDGDVNLMSKIMKGSELIPLPYEFESQNSQRIFFFMLVLIIGFTFTIFTSPIGTLVLIGFVAFLKLIGWFSISNISTVSTESNLAISAAVIMVSGVIALGLLLRKGD